MILKYNPLKIIMILFIFSGCNIRDRGEYHENPLTVSEMESVDVVLETAEESENLAPESESVGREIPLSETERRMEESGLVNVQELDPSIAVDMKYNTTDNFLGKKVYDDISRAYLQPEVAEMLVKSQQYLKSIHPELSLIVYDATRPLSAHQKLWDAVDAPFEEKIRFLSNPANGSVHNFGAAVDVSIIDAYGNALDMGTEFDHMGELAYPELEIELLEEGLLAREQVENRRLLRRVMRHGGFWGIQTEWWHFNAFSRAEARERFEMVK
jgi:zinc D-Ala-D-Ala dipeptidase